MGLSVIMAIDSNVNCSISSLNYMFRNIGTSDFELIIVNDGLSEDKLLKINKFISRFKNDTVYLTNPKKGIFSSWNLGISNSTNNYNLILHNDCFLLEGTYSKLYNFITSETATSQNIKCVIPRTDSNITNSFLKNSLEGYKQMKYNEIKDSVFLLLNSKKNIDLFNFNAAVVDEQYKDTYLILNEMHTYCMLFEKDTFLSLGGFDEDFDPNYYAEQLLKFKFSLNNINVAFVNSSFVKHVGSEIDSMLNDEHRTLYDSKVQLLIDPNNQL